MTALQLPAADGTPTSYELGEPGRWTKPSKPITSRIAYAAAHVVPAVLAENTPGAPAVIDWDTTLAYRHELWSYGLGVADAMDTAQRGMGLDWPATQELIKRSSAEAASAPQTRTTDSAFGFNTTTTTKSSALETSDPCKTP